MPFIDEFLVGTAFPASSTAAMRPVALHAPATRAAGAWNYMPVEATVDTLERIHLDNPDIGIINSGVTVSFHSSQAIVQFIFGVAPEAMLRSPRPFAVPTMALISLFGLAFQV